jgi:site-specific recombinase XerD
MINMKNEITVYKKNELDIQESAWSALSVNSQLAYKYDYALFNSVINKKTSDITAKDILIFIEHLRTHNYKNASINRKIASLSKMFKVLLISGEIKHNPVEQLKLLKRINMPVEKEVKLNLTMNDIREAIRGFKAHSVRDKKLILVIRALVKSGLRISELLHIKNIDIKPFQDGTSEIRIIGKGRKERFIFLEDSFITEIKKIWDEDIKFDLLFYRADYKPYDRRNLGAEITEFFQRKIGKHVHPHMLRHLFATYKINTEKADIKSVSKYLGHSDVSITLNSYVDTALTAKQSKIKI